WCAPSPRLRGEGWGEGRSTHSDSLRVPLTRMSSSMPTDLSPQAGRGDLGYIDYKRGGIMPANIMILNGPNLNFLGIREPHIYGSTTLKEIEASCQQLAKLLGVSISFHQSNLEGELVNLIQSAHGKADAIIMNPAAYSFTSIALIDALKIFEGPKIEVHISNIHARDELHRHSITSSASTAVICGLGPYDISRRCWRPCNGWGNCRM
ncbi:MAG: 3-dehydroquinate dehydratase, partial [Alphaproteobacteria bacterium]|nr:3-dehydroquinate dehydratase [Alphaproteobacteria bacterium]